jgi:hypothetical protein
VRWYLGIPRGTPAGYPGVHRGTAGWFPGVPGGGNTCKHSGNLQIGIPNKGVNLAGNFGVYPGVLTSGCPGVPRRFPGVPRGVPRVTSSGYSGEGKEHVQTPGRAAGRGNLKKFCFATKGV